MIDFLKLYFLSFVTFLGIDMLWLGLVAKNFYRVHLAPLMADQVRFGAAFLFYVIYVFGFVVFVILPSLESKSLIFALFRGALFGLVCYATYDLTNLATIKNFPMKVVVVDLLWGTCITALTAAFVVFIKKITA